MRVYLSPSLLQCSQQQRRRSFDDVQAERHRPGTPSGPGPRVNCAPNTKHRSAAMPYIFQWGERRAAWMSAGPADHPRDTSSCPAGNADANCHPDFVAHVPLSVRNRRTLSS